jgi:prepilin-type N-terminal cleavage/methylation domain-containing protein
MRKPRDRRTHRVARSGFSLMELMTVLVIGGLMLALAIPRVDTAKYHADAVAQIIRTTLQTSQRQAITRQEDVVVSFDTTGERIRIVWDGNDNGQIDSTDRVQWRGLESGILFSDPSVNGVSGEAIKAPVTGSNIGALSNWPTITFHRDGAVSTSAEIYVSIPSHGPKIYRALVLTQATGRVDWYRLNTSTNQWVVAGQ